MRRSLAIFLLLLTLFAGYWRREQAVRGQAAVTPLRELARSERAKSGAAEKPRLLIVLVHGVDVANRNELFLQPSALMPVRDGGVGWDLVDVLRTGSRNELASGAATLGETLRKNGVSTIAFGPNASRLLGVDDRAKGDLVLPASVAAALTPGACVAVEINGLSMNAFAQRLSEAMDRRWVLRPDTGGPPELWIGIDAPSDEAARGARFSMVALKLGGRVGALTSPSTGGRPGIIAATDIAATVAALCDLPESVRLGAGRPLQISGTKRRLDEVAADVAAQAREQKGMRYVPWALAALLLCASRFERRTPRLLYALFMAGSAYPLGLLLAPAAVSGFLVYGVAAIFSVVAGVIGLRNMRAAPALALMVTFTIAIDLLLGGPLLWRSPFSYAFVEAARFYGIGNEVEGYLLGAAFFLASRWRGIDGVLVGVSAAILLGLPWLGADVGGALAACVGIAVVAVGLAPPGQRRRAWLVGGLVCVLALIGLGALDLGRGAVGRTHWGEALASGPASMAALVWRKVSMNAHLLVSSPWAFLLLVEGIVYGWRMRWGGARTAGTSLIAVALAGFLVNDSGVLVGALAGWWLWEELWAPKNDIAMGIRPHGDVGEETVSASAGAIVSD